MSEYHYYEFVAVDGPISDEGMRYAEGCSSRAEVSRMRWRNVYHFGDFGGKVVTLLNDQAASQLKELHDAHEQAGETARFQQRLTAFRERYARRPAMLRRIGDWERDFERCRAGDRRSEVEFGCVLERACMFHVRPPFP